MADEHFESFHFRLADGTPVEFHTITPEDRERIREGFALVSEQSRYLRFFAPLNDLSDQQLEYLTDVDQDEHVAWGIIDLAHPEQPGLGVGRFIRDPSEADVAEVAVTVADEFQHRGVGSALFGILYLRAMDLGVQTLRAYILPENRFIAEILSQLGGTVQWHDNLMQVDVPIVENWARLEDTDLGASFVELLHHLDDAREPSD
ncbi:MAG: N-acetyltransferase [Bacteroidetes bacterium]|jgi:GNAT superfamily N-acetyltransferase|nr:N-acetyltransferase [Bacteroidota bacterium]